MNDAAMQALGSYKRGLLLFLGLGTGLGAALVADGVVIPMELAHLPYKNGTWEDYLGARSLDKRGRKKWRQHVEFAVARLTDALAPDDIVLGGGNAKKLKKLPKGCRLGDNSFCVYRRLSPVGESVRRAGQMNRAPRRRRRRPAHRAAGLDRRSTSTIATFAPCTSASCLPRSRSAASA